MLITSALTEKTLELNIMAELAYIGRRAGYRPYFIGISQIEEIKNGVDTFFKSGSRIGFFQFKRGRRWSTFYTFYINNNAPHFNQHLTLSATHAASNACRYLFPLVSTNQDIYKHRGNLLWYTAPFRPDSFDPLVPSNTKHRVRVYDDGKWIRYSEEKEGSWNNLYGSLPTDEPIEEELQSEEEYKEVFNNLDLPKLEDTLEPLRKKEIEDIFRQRGLFCMILSE